MVGKRTDLVQFCTLGRLLGVELPETVKPCDLKQLLGEEEGSDEIWLWTEEGKIPVIDILHVGGGEQSILLGGKVDDERHGRLKQSSPLASPALHFTDCKGFRMKDEG